MNSNPAPGLRGRPDPRPCASGDRRGAYGKIAVTYVEWAGATSQRIVVPWTVIASRGDAERFVARFSPAASSARRTSISGALDFGSDCSRTTATRARAGLSTFPATGPTIGPPINYPRRRDQARHRYQRPAADDPRRVSAPTTSRSRPLLPRLRHRGPGAFMIPVNDWTQFPEAIRRKLVLELAGSASPQWASGRGRSSASGAGAGQARQRLPGWREDVAQPQLDVRQTGCLPLRPKHWQNSWTALSSPVKAAVEIEGAPDETSCHPDCSRVRALCRWRQRPIQ